VLLVQTRSDPAQPIPAGTFWICFSGSGR